MNYTKAMNECKYGKKIRCDSMKEGEYLFYDEDESQINWQLSDGIFSYPQDMDCDDYLIWIFEQWEIID